MALSLVYPEEFAAIESRRPKQIYRDLTKLPEAEILGVKNIDQTSLSDVIEELIAGLYTPGFDQAFLEHVTQMQKEHPNERYVEYWDNGQMKFDATFKNGIPDGHFHGWYYHGQDAFKGFHRAGVRVGVHMGFFWTKSYTNRSTNPGIGRLFNYNEMGILDGEQKTKYEDHGRLESSIYYRNGVLHGTAVCYHGPREEVVNRLYRNGELVQKARKKK